MDISQHPSPETDPFLGVEPELPPPPEDSGEGPAEDTTPTDAAAPDDGDPEAGPRQKYPSWSELRSARKERDALAQRLEAMENALGRMQQHLRPPQPQAPPPPDKDEDPLGYLEWQNEMLRNQQAQLYQSTQQQQQQQQLMQLRDSIRDQENAFLRQNPDYFDAVNFMREREAQRARMMMGQDAPDEAVAQMVAAREQLIINLAFQKNQSVPSIAYQLAKMEGWNGAGPGQKAPGPQQRVRASQQRGQVARTSVGGIPGQASANTRGISRDQVLQMTEQDMERLDRELPNWQEYITD